MRKIWISTALTGGAICCIGLFKFCGEKYFAPKTAGLNVVFAGAVPDVLFVGSSHARQSYDARAIEAAINTNVGIVAYDGMAYNLTKSVIDGIVVQKRIPRILVLDAYCMLLARDGHLEDSRLFFDAQPKLKLQLLRYIRENETLGNAIADCFGLLVNVDNELIVAWPVQHRLLDTLSYHGAYNGKIVLGLRTFKGLHFDASGATIQNEQVRALRSCINNARKAGITVVAIASPMPGPIERLPQIAKLNTEMEAILAECSVPYFDGSSLFPIDSPELFADSNHLSSAGRAVFSSKAAAFIAHFMVK